tara:strand:+ start:12143 stop:12643 length:501 start_codon:yes stop_codon:yes gene_type:complete
MATTTSINTYGVPVSLSVNKGIKSKYKRRAGLAYPLVKTRKVVPTGILQKNLVGQATYFGQATGIELIQNNLLQLIKTEKGERVMLPDYGLALQKYLFEPLDETTFDLLKQDILKNIRKYFSVARVLALLVFSDSESADNNTLVIKLTMQLLDESLDVFDIEAKVG